ncbi:acyltransferase [Clostridium chromiireducens]|uniref:Acyltransferase n=1 Tax=Clostridium chromiireducens TaxID=225345 RepID=A0A399IQZ0_9CLOT|nr:acyltransferase [Clostridium chromiireducens]RII35017.1 acyltransferase [Clostridium chromiireducens]
MRKLKNKIKNTLLRLKIKLKYKKSYFEVGDNVFISTKAKIIMGKNSKLIICNNSYISDSVRLIVHDNSELIIDERVYVSINTIISSNSKVSIGSDTSIAHNVTIIDTNKNYSNINLKIKEQGAIAKPIVIDNDCWIAAGVVILPGVSLGKHCVVAANAAVNKSFEASSVLGGVPAKLLNKLG